MSDPSFSFSKEDEISKWLFENTGYEKFSPGFHRVSSFLSPFKENYFKDLPIITVGGTNGKGSVCHYVKNKLTSEGLKVGMWSSPHVLTVKERFFLGDGHPTYDELFDSLREVYKSVRPSYYELLFLTFCQMARERNLDALIFEVGLGGRLDTVNFFDAAVCGITSISRDHQEFLGNSYKSILKEKLGISRKDRPLITSLELKLCRDVMSEYCGSETPHVDLFEEGLLTKKDSFIYRNALMGEALVATMRESRIPLRHELCELRQKLNLVKLNAGRGRLQMVTLDDRSFIFIGAHNLDGFRKLKNALIHNRDLQNLAPFSRTVLSFSKRDMKEIMACIKSLNLNFPSSKEPVVTSFEHPKAVEESELINLESLGLAKFEKSWKKIFHSKGTYLVLGSYYFIGEVQKYLAVNSRPASSK